MNSAPFPHRVKTMFAATLAAMLLAACAPPGETQQPLKVVRVRVAGSDDGSATRRYAGEVRARYETVLAFRLAGKIARRLVDSGTKVAAGQTLAQLDPGDTTFLADQAEAQRALAEADLKRYRGLREKNFISQSALDARETAYKAAAAQAGLAQNQAGYTTLVADRAGVVAAVLAEAGQVVAAGQPVARLVPDGDREVAISIPESEVARYAVGREAKVSFWASGDTVVAGRLREIAAAADPATRTYAARVALEKADPHLPVGLTATVSFDEPAIGKGVLVPLSAIFQKDGAPALWIVGADAVAILRPVTVQRYRDGGAEVVAGLDVGERYVEAGVHKIVAGEKLRIADKPAAR